MSTALITIRNLLSRHERLTTVSASALVLMAVALMGLVSLMTLNDKATKGYVLNELESERQELVTDGEITEMLSLRAASMHSIQSSDIVRRMVEPDRSDIVYVLPMSAVAQR